jgi:nucleoside-diphosphate-sugar epimerase
MESRGQLLWRAVESRRQQAAAAATGGAKKQQQQGQEDEHWRRRRRSLGARRPRRYGYSKILNEHLADRYWRASQLPVTVIRFANAWGAGSCGRVCH